MIFKGSILERAMPCLRTPEPRTTRAVQSDPLKASRTWKTSSHASALLNLVVLFLLLLPGCTLCQNVKRSVLSEPTRFSVTADRWRSVRTYREWAEEAYGRFCGCGTEVPFSESYEIGFKDGFIDFVYAGGSGEPPPVPPREFWDVRKRNPNGQACAADWFDGYRHGARIAREEGYRERALVPTSKLIECPTEVCQHPIPLTHDLVTPLVEPSQPAWLEAESVPLGPLAPTPEKVSPEQTVPDSQALEPMLPEPTEIPADLETSEIGEVPMPVLEESQPAAPLPVELAPLEPTDPATEQFQAPEAESDPDTSEEIDDLFGPPDGLRSTDAKRTRTLRKRPHHRESLSVQQARDAFTTAIQRQYHAKLELAKARPLLDQVEPASANLALRPEGIPRHNDQSKAMFQRLSN